MGADEEDVGNAILYVAIGLLVAEIPRLYYLCTLCGYCCCGGKTKDDVASRSKLIMAMNALAINQGLSAILVIIIVLAAGGTFTSNIIMFLLEFVVGIALTLWWRMDIMKWVENKKAIEGTV
jgi:hypothetical protein